MEKIRVAVAGYGNIGKCAVEAALEAPDMELAGVVSRRTGSVGKLSGAPLTNAVKGKSLANIPVTNDVKELGKVDVILLCGTSRSIPDTAEEYLAQGIHTVDSFDIHGDELWSLRQQLDEAGKKYNTVSIVSAGWDPGSDSVVRTLWEAMAPTGITFTNFGPGMSMGHTVAVKSKAGIRNALSMSIPTGAGAHHRAVYVELEPDADFTIVEQAIKTDAYFIDDYTTVTQVDNVNALIDMGHSVLMERKGVSGITHNQLFEYRMKINNPALTAQIMTACTRAAMRLKPGAYTMPEIPVMDLLPGNREQLVKNLV